MPGPNASVPEEEQAGGRIRLRLVRLSPAAERRRTRHRIDRLASQSDPGTGSDKVPPATRSCSRMAEVADHTRSAKRLGECTRILHTGYG